MAQPEKIQTSNPTKTVTVIINNREGLEIVQLPHRGQDAHKRVIPGGMVTLIPGLNLVDSDTLAIMRKNPAFDAKFSTKIPPSKAPEQNPELVGRPVLVQGKVLPADKPLAALPDAEALELIEEADDVLLAQFKEQEGRTEVRMAIIKRIESLSIPTVTE